MSLLTTERQGLDQVDEHEVPPEQVLGWLNDEIALARPVEPEVAPMSEAGQSVPSDSIRRHLGHLARRAVDSLRWRNNSDQAPQTLGSIFEGWEPPKMSPRVESEQSELSEAVAASPSTGPTQHTPLTRQTREDIFRNWEPRRWESPDDARTRETPRVDAPERTGMPVADFGTGHEALGKVKHPHKGIADEGSPFDPRAVQETVAGAALLSGSSRPGLKRALSRMAHAEQLAAPLEGPVTVSSDESTPIGDDARAIAEKMVGALHSIEDRRGSPEAVSAATAHPYARVAAGIQSRNERLSRRARDEQSSSLGS